MSILINLFWKSYNALLAAPVAPPYEIISVLRDGPSPDGKISNVVDDNEWFFHHIAGSRYRKNIITEYAKNYNEQNKG